MKKLGLLALALVAASTVAVAPSAHADDPCTDPNGLGLGVISIGNGNSPTLYIDDRNYALGNGLWIYMESNNVFNLQRGDTADVDPLYATGLFSADTDACVDASPNGPDFLIF